jgi:hypothetical protein
MIDDARTPNNQSTAMFNRPAETKRKSVSQTPAMLVKSTSWEKNYSKEGNNGP